ncbi:MAG: hypothetical protein R2752_10605 [Vicinamibacterales bacterium]
MTIRRRLFTCAVIAVGGAAGVWAMAPPAGSTRLAAGAATGLAADAAQMGVPPAAYSGLHWRMLGPFRSGRTDAASGVPGRPYEFYFGAVNGGVWKTINAGRSWEPVFDDQPVASIGALAVAPSKPDVVYVGTGESTLRDSMSYGNGMYRSTDAGHTWTHVGLDDTQHIVRVAVDPKNADVVYVAALGHLYEANDERGVFKSTNGGATWTKVLFKGPDVGASEVVIDPTNSRVVYAALWNTRRPPWFTYPPSNGPGGGLFKSTDAGATWTAMTAGLPGACIGKAGIGISPANPRRLYAVVDDFLPEGAAPGTPCPSTPTPPAPAGAGRGGGGGAAAEPQQGGVFRSDDAGATWTKLSGDMALWGRGWYFEHVVVDPKNADIVYVSNVSISRSTDGGRTWEALRGSPGGDDYHQAWISPDDSNVMISSGDQGAIISTNVLADPADVEWTSWLNQPIAQIYHLSVDYRFPYWITGAQQDSGAVAVRSRGKFGEIWQRDWEPIGAGGESGMTAGDPLHPGIVYGGTGQRYDMALNTSVGPTTSPRTPDGEAARTDWTQPLVLSPADPHALYYANQYVFKSTDAAASWTRISPDLTRPDPGVPASLDPTSAGDVDRNDKRGVVYTIAPSPIMLPKLWVGTDDGLIHLTTDDGGHWQDVTPAAVGPWSRITTIEASHYDVDTAYATVDRHQLNDFDPHLYRTRDNGRTWQEITRGIPKGAYLHVVREDPATRGLLVAGSERGAYVSFDDGDSWQSLQLNLPTTSVRDFQFYGNDLIVATHGRGFWVIDDIAPLRQAPAAAATDVYLFKPSVAIDVIQGGDNGTPVQKDEPQAENPPDGAYIDYYLKNDATGDVTIEVLNEAGDVLQTFGTGTAAGGRGRGGRGGGRGGGIPNTSILWRMPPAPFATTAGMHRVVWSPRGGGRGFGGGGRGGRGGGAPTTGTFTVRLTAGGRTFTQPLVIQPDPRR